MSAGDWFAYRSRTCVGSSALRRTACATWLQGVRPVPPAIMLMNWHWRGACIHVKEPGPL
eukprot:2347713-Pyramimonas_sp.AAC.1